MEPDPRAEVERLAMARLARQAPVLRAALESVRESPQFQTDLPGRLCDIVNEALAFDGAEPGETS